MRILETIEKYMSMVKFSHSIFGFPFAIIGFAAGIREIGVFPENHVFIFVVLSVLFARNAAMSFNRYIDRDFDKANPRTKNRELPQNKIKPKSALRFAIFNAVMFFVSAALINPLCFYLSPIALAVIIFYSYTKRISYLCHFVLGAGLMIVPMGAYLAVTGFFSVYMVMLSIAVMFWVAGFDILYAIQDIDFDRENKLHSIPSSFGDKKALIISRLTHLMAFIFMFLWVFLSPEIEVISIIGVIIFFLAILRQHSLVKPGNYQKINSIFFLYNGLASILLSIIYLLNFLY